MLLQERTPFTKWPSAQRTLAQNLNYKSSSTYEFMRSELKFQLPSKTSIYRWIPIKRLQPGPNDILFEHLKIKISSMNSLEKEAVLIFDEVAIRKQLSYNQHADEVDGVVDYGEDDRTSEIGKHVCLFLIRGLCSSWKYVLSYYVTKEAMQGMKLSSILQNNLTYAMELGLNIRAVVCDQGPNNRKCLKILGITVNNPYFVFNSKKVFVLYDPPHLIKSFRNALLTNNIKTSDGEVSWSVYQELHNLDCSNIVKMCPKLTEKHLNPNQFEKMRVKYATQIFSRSVAGAIQTCVDLSHFKNNSKAIIHSIKIFTEKIDRLFDCLNSRVRDDKNIYKSSIKRDGNNYVTDYLKEMIAYINSFSLKIPKRNYCFEGMILTINAVLQLRDEMFNSNETVQFLLTNKLNQDPIENLFGQIRAKGGNNKNPSVFEFNYIVARLMSMKILSPFSQTGNCENDDEDLLLDWNQQMHTNPSNLNEDCAISFNNTSIEDTSEALILNEHVPPDEDVDNRLVSAILCGGMLLEDAAKRYYFVKFYVNKILNMYIVLGTIWDTCCLKH